MGLMDCPRCGYPVGRVGDSTVRSAAQDDRDAALAADRARIAQAIRWEHQLRQHFPKESAEVVLERLLRIVEGG